MNTMWSCKRVTEKGLDDLLGKIWGTRKGEKKGDFFRFYACKDNVVVRYHIACQMLYLSF